MRRIASIYPRIGWVEPSLRALCRAIATFRTRVRGEGLGGWFACLPSRGALGSAVLGPLQLGKADVRVHRVKS